MRQVLLLLSACLVMSLLFAHAAVAQQGGVDCAEVQSKLNGGGGNVPLTPAILLSCDLSPEAIGQGPSIGEAPGPDTVGPNNECSGLPDGSAAKIACYEELIAGLPGRGQPAPGPDSVTGTPYAPDAAQYANDEEVAGLPDTGGPALLPIAGGLIALGVGGLLLRRRLS